MIAARIVEFGTLQVMDVETPTPGTGEALIAIRASGVNPSDTGNLAGRFPQTRLPRTPGRDYAGVVVQGPSEWVGKEVFGTGAELGFTRDGSHAEFIVVPVGALREKPTNLTMAQAAAVGTPFSTAWLATVRGAQIQKGETLAVIGSRGAVGSAAIQIGRWLGVRTIGIQRGLEGGIADFTVDSEKEDVAARVLELTNGKGADACLDTVSGPFFNTCIAFMGHGGRLATIVAKGDGQVTFNLRDFYHHELRLIGVDSLKHDSVESGAMLGEMSAGFESGMLVPAPTRKFSLHEAPAVYEYVAKNVYPEKLVFES